MTIAVDEREGGEYIWATVKGACFINMKYVKVFDNLDFCKRHIEGEMIKFMVDWAAMTTHSVSLPSSSEEA